MSHGFLHRAGAAARSPIMAGGASTRRVFVAAEVATGWLVRDADGMDVGRVAGLEGEYLAVSRGFGRSRLYVPITGLSAVTEGRVRLSLTANQIEGSRWIEKPNQGH
jgi:hypothetical protein